MPSPRAIATLVACVSLAFVAAPLRAQVSSESLNEAVANMSSGDRDKVVAGRTSLLALLNASRTNPPALTTFSRDIGTALLPIASGNDPHAKLNVAIVAQRVAEQSGAASLADLCTKLISDGSPAVSAYGLRAASFVVPRMLITAPSDPIVNAIVGSVEAHPESEAVATESYLAIVRILNDRTAGDTLTPAGVTAATPRAVDAVHKLLAARIAQYGTGTLAEPTAEQAAVSFLGRQGTWNLSKPPQQNQTIKLLLQLLQGTAAEMGQVPNTPASRLRLEALRNLVKSTAGSLSVITQLANKPELLPTVQKAAGLGLATPVNDYKQTIAQIVTEFAHGMPDAAPASQPATQTTAPAAAK